MNKYLILFSFFFSGELKPEEKWQCLEGKQGKPVAPKMNGCSHRKSAQCNSSESACQLACEANAECVGFDYAPKKAVFSALCNSKDLKY